MAVFLIAATGQTIVADAEFMATAYPHGGYAEAQQEAAPTLPESLRITRLAFRNRFSLTEKATLELAALDNPAAAMPQRQQAAMLRAYLADLSAASHVDLGRADTRAGVQMLESAGLIAAGRADQILDAPIEAMEREAA